MKLKMIGRILLSLGLITLFLPLSAFAAARTASVSGNWNSTATWGGSSIPVAGDTVTINSGVIVTVTAAAACTSVSFVKPTANNGITISGTNTLAVSGAITTIAPTNNNRTTTISVGAGTLTAGSIALAATTGTGRYSSLTLSTGTVTVSGNITTAGTGSRIIFSGSGIINAGGTFMSGTAGTFTASTGTVNFNGAGVQTIASFGYTFNNVTLSGSGTKAISSTGTINGKLSIAPDLGGATANITAGITKTVGSLMIGGLGTINGTWGSTSSAATYTNNTYFSATTGKLSVTNDTRTAQTTLIAVATPSTVPYGTTSTLSSTGGSGTGVVTFSVGASTGCSITGGTTLNVSNASGTCTVTATKAADANYTSATSAGLSVTLQKANQTTLTAIATPSTVPYGITSTLSTSGGTGTGSVTFDAGLSTGCSILGTTLSVIDASGSCSITATKAADSNYNSITSSPITVTLTKGTQAALTAIAAPSTVPYGTTSTLSTSGGTGTGSVTFDAGLSTGCSILGTTLSVIDASGSCSITATKASDSNYNSITSSPITVTLTNPTPSISNISPTAKNVGDTDFSLTVNGSNFIPGSIVNLNGSSRVTTFVNSTQLTAIITTADMSTAGDKTITVTNSAPGGGTSNSKTLTVVLAATQFVITSAPSGSVDASITVRVEAQKSNNTMDTSYNGSVTLNITGAASGGGVVTITSGFGTLDITDHTAETSHLSLTDSANTHLDVSSTAELVFAPGTVSQYSLNNPGNMDARTRLGYTITRKDQYGNSVLAGALTAKLYTNSTSTAHRFYSDSLLDDVITKVSFTGGFATAQFWYYEEAADTYTITVSDNLTSPDGTTGIDDADQTVTVRPVAVKFVILPVGPGTVDAPVTVTVEARKTDDSVDTTFQDDVTLNTNLSATGGGVVPILNGVGTKTISDTMMETVRLSLTDSETTHLDVSSTLDLVFNGGVTRQFTLTRPVGTLSAGSRMAYTLSRKDQHGNVTSTGAVTAYLYSTGGVHKKFYDAATDGTVITSVIIPDGQSSVSFWYYDETPGTISVTASDGFPTANGPTGLTDAVDVLQVVSGSVAQLILSAPAEMTASTRLGYTVTRKDSFGNLVTIGNTTLGLSTSGGVLGATRAFFDAASGGNSISAIDISDGNSQVSFWYYEEVTGAYIVTVGSMGVPDATANVTVNAAPIIATKFVILPPTNGTVDAPIDITIQAQDNAGNIEATSTAVTLVASGSVIGGGGEITLSGGVGTIHISDHLAQTVHLTLSDTDHTGLDVSSSMDVTFAPGAVSQFTIDNPGDIGAGQRIGFTLTRKDQYGNLVTSGVTAAELSSSPIGTNQKFYDAETNGTVITAVNFVDGQSTVQFWYYDEKAGTVAVSVSGTSVSPAIRSFNVTPASIAKYVIDNPGNMTAGTRLEYTLIRKDQFDNLVTSGVVSAYLYSSSGSASAKFYGTASGGTPMLVTAFSDGQSLVHFWYYEESPGSWTVAASDGTPVANGAVGILDAADSVTVSLSPIVATRLVIQSTGDSTINTSKVVTVRAEDDNGNVDTTYNDTVTLVATGAVTGEGVVTITNGVGTITITDAVTESVVLSLFDSHTTGLNVASTQVFSFIAAFIPPVAAVGGQSGSGGPILLEKAISSARFSGKTFPSAILNIIPIGGTTIYAAQKTTASKAGDFSLTFSNIPGGASSYAVIGTDKSNHSTQIKTFDVNLANSKAVLNASDILLSPTLGLVRTAATQGDVLGISGSANPKYKIEIQVDGRPIPTSSVADSSGIYKALVPTAPLDFGSHSIRTRQITPLGVKSDFSPQQVFSVVNIFTPNMDLNSDGRLSVQDYSVFVARFSSSDPKTRAKDDLNGDSKVDVQDMSIFMKALKI